MKALIIEDEPMAAERLEDLLEEINPNIEVVEVLDSIAASVEWLQENTMPDLFFLDIHLADGSSFKIFQHVEIKRPIIFTTAYDEHAIEAFQVNAIDYLLKPIKRPALKKALKKFGETSQRINFDVEKLQSVLGKNQPSKRFLIRFGQTMKVVDILDVSYFYTSDKITFLVTKKGKRYPIEYSLDQLTDLANPRNFFRANRQFIVHIKSIVEMHAHTKSRVKLVLNPPTESRIIVSSERTPLLKTWLVGED